MSLRERLRRDTRADHDRVDAAFGAFALGTAPGLRAFLQAQGAGLAALRGAEGAGDVADDLDRALGAIAADLAALGGRLPPAIPFAGPDHATARRYLWLGSRLGARVLARSWAASADPAVRAAGSYMGAAADPAPWRRFLADAGAHPAVGPEADRVVAATRAWFALFEAAALRETDAAAPERRHA
ncbi:hypothetical protein [Jannaschia sp. W003]|uniref:hypothetical protein n=1 Tax=Jannaschia sp. W003 TaxID=2867012 RepID=UPI0021A5B023|nr:hypothetical protein [Jannaschia sp. W003]UWQ21302.1 hypothetical protein K3554_15225 [Jannaschia sp. W003]